MQLLSDGERLRAERLMNMDDRKSFLAAHTLKRLMLAAMTGNGAAGLEFHTDPLDKPHLSGQTDIHFNLSHTRGMVACVCSRFGAVGVDVESIGNAQYEPGTARLSLTMEEMAAVEASNDPLRTFLLLWVAKEAVAKAEGQGVSLPFTSIRVAPGMASTPSSKWSIRACFLSDAHAVALAWKGQDDSAPENEPSGFIIQEADLWRWAASGTPPLNA